MPDINNNTKTNIAAEKLFEIPKRRLTMWRLITPLLLIIALAAGWFAHALIPNAAAPEAAVIPQQEIKSEVISEQDSAYYLANDKGTAEIQGAAVRLYRYSQNPRESDVLIQELNDKYFRVVGKSTNTLSYIGFNTKNDLFTLDATTGKTEVLFNIESNSLIREVAISSDKKWLAYGRNYEGGPVGGQSGGSIWLYNLETKEQKQLVKNTELGLYQGFGILGWRDTDKELVVTAFGGDAGATWGELYLVNSSTGALTKVQPVAEKNEMEFLRGKLSPDNNQWLYEHCEKPDTVVREEEGLGGRACTSGTELRVYNFDTKKIRTVYQNLRYETNVDKSLLRVFMSYDWQDNENVVAIVPGAILDIPTQSSGKVVETYLFDASQPQSYVTRYKELQSATKERIVFSSDEGWQVYDRESKKLTSINAASRNEEIGTWLD